MLKICRCRYLKPVSLSKAESFIKCSMHIQYLRSRFRITHCFDTVQICDWLSRKKFYLVNALLSYLAALNC